MAIDPTPVYRRTLARWIAGQITIREVELLTKTRWLTREQADDIYKHERAHTPLVDGDPYTPEIVTQYRLEVE